MVGHWWCNRSACEKQVRIGGGDGGEGGSEGWGFFSGGEVGGVSTWGVWESRFNFVKVVSSLFNCYRQVSGR